MSDELRLAADVGGTFTDIVAADSDGHVTRYKRLSTPPYFEDGVVAGLETCTNGNLDAMTTLLHASTVATNAILEGRGPCTGLLTTEGFRDVLEIGRLRYPRLYDLGFSSPDPLVDRQLRLGVSERIGADGTVVRTLDKHSLRRAIDTLIAAEVKSVAICLLNAYVNDRHERDIESEVRRRMPDVTISRSAAVLPLIGEYDRTSTTVINAFLQPVMGAYIRQLATSLQDLGTDAPILILQSSGGVLPAATAAEYPVFALESGPTAGVLSTAQLAQDRGLSHALAFDMGGTTAKAAVVLNGKPAITPEFEVGSGMSSSSRLTRGSGYLVRAPSIDLAEIGAGGGSIVKIDPAGGMTVGPDSAGANPGPACYGRGGVDATLTDINVVLGYINPLALLGSALTIDAASAERVVAKNIARPLGTNVLQAASAAHRVAVAELARALRAVTSERGVNPKVFTIVAFGGGGPGMAASLAQALGIRRVLVPSGSGVFSAMGLLGSDLRWMATHSALITLSSRDAAAQLASSLKLLRDRCVGLAQAGGYQRRNLRFEAVAECRYRGQSFELGTPIGPGRVTQRTIAELRDRFETQHVALYGHRDPDSEVVAATLRVTAIQPTTQITVRETLTSSRGNQHRKAWFDGRWRVTPVLQRGDVRTVTGPAIVEDYDATTVIPPNWRCTRQHDHSLLLEALT